MLDDLLVLDHQASMTQEVLNFGTHQDTFSHSLLKGPFQNMNSFFRLEKRAFEKLEENVGFLSVFIRILHCLFQEGP